LAKASLRKRRDFADEEEVLGGVDRRILKQAEVGVAVAELIRKAEITERTYYR
jgi:hypothetical protein